MCVIFLIFLKQMLHFWFLFIIIPNSSILITLAIIENKVLDLEEKNVSPYFIKLF